MVRLKYAPEDRAEIAATLRLHASASRQEPGCVYFLPHQLESDPDTFLIYEQYRDPEALAAHRETPHFQKYVAGILYKKMLDRSREDLAALV